METAAQNLASNPWTEKRGLQGIPAGRRSRERMNLNRMHAQEGIEK